MTSVMRAISAHYLHLRDIVQDPSTWPAKENCGNRSSINQASKGNHSYQQDATNRTYITDAWVGPNRRGKTRCHTPAVKKLKVIPLALIVEVEKSIPATTIIEEIPTTTSIA